MSPDAEQQPLLDKHRLIPLRPTFWTGFELAVGESEQLMDEDRVKWIEWQFPWKLGEDGGFALREI